MLITKQAPIETSPLRLSNVAVQELGREEIQVRVSACGVCHTDLHEVEGDLHVPGLPRIPGHEVIGTVSKKGESCRMLKSGIAWE